MHISAPEKNSRVLHRGEHGEDVRKLQDLLQELGYPIRVDGRFGPETEAAVRDVQAHAHIAVDGDVGPDTLRAITTLHEEGYHAPEGWHAPEPAYGDAHDDLYKAENDGVLVEGEANIEVEVPVHVDADPYKHEDIDAEGDLPLEEEAFSDESSTAGYEED